MAVWFLTVVNDCLVLSSSALFRAGSWRQKSEQTFSRPPPGETCLKNLPREASRTHLEQVPGHFNWFHSMQRILVYYYTPHSSRVTEVLTQSTNPPANLMLHFSLLVNENLRHLNSSTTFSGRELWARIWSSWFSSWLLDTQLQNCPSTCWRLMKPTQQHHLQKAEKKCKKVLTPAPAYAWIFCRLNSEQNWYQSESNMHQKQTWTKLLLLLNRDWTALS